MIKDLIKNTKKNLTINRIRTQKDINRASFSIVEFSNKIKDSENEIRFFLRTKMYNNHDIQDGINANLFKLEELVEIDFFKDIYKKYKKKSINIIIKWQLIRLLETL